MPTIEMLGLVGVVGLAAAVGGSLWHTRSRHAIERARLLSRLRPRPLTEADVLSVLRRVSGRTELGRRDGEIVRAR